MNITRTDMKRDLDATINDVVRLQAICVNLARFIADTDENRNAFRVDLFKYQGLLERGRALERKIRETIAQSEVAWPAQEQDSPFILPSETKK